MANSKTKVKGQTVVRYRCPDNIFRYCDTEPDWQTRPTLLHTRDKAEPQFDAGGSCKQDWHTCGHCRTLKQIIGDLSLLNPTASIERVPE